MVVVWLGRLKERGRNARPRRKRKGRSDKRGEKVGGEERPFPDGRIGGHTDRQTRFPDWSPISGDSLDRFYGQSSMSSFRE